MTDVLSGVLLSRSRPAPSDNSDVMLLEVLSSLVCSSCSEKSCLCPKQTMMETSSSFPCVLSVLQLCCHNIHQVGIHQHKLFVGSKWSDSVSDFIDDVQPNVG